MRVFCYFVEPASYTLDLAKNVYEKNDIDYCFIKSYSLVKSELKPSKIFLNKFSVIQKIKHVFSTFKNHDFIIVNGYNNYPFILTFLFNLFSFNKRYIAIESDTQLVIPNNFEKRFIKWLYLSFIFRNKYVLGFPGGSNSHKDLFMNYGMQEERIFLMPMMVDNSKYFQAKKKFPDTFTFLYVGRLVKHKNVENLIKQFNINFKDTNALLRIIGSGDEEEYLRKMYSSEKVIFEGKKFSNDLVRLYQNSSCFVCPSIYEPWGLVVNEALSAGLAVIATKEVGSTFNLIKNKETGLIAENMDDFGHKMLQIFNNEVLLRKYSNNARELMQNYWNYEFYSKAQNEVIIKVKKWN